MSKNAAIDIFLRVRPTKRPFPGLELNKEQNKVEFHVPKDAEKGYVNNQTEDFKFNFNQMFGMETKQEEIFENIVKDVADSALEGYNGTVFAYGQTGSGKTFTMTGGAERYPDRGIIPRTLSYIFQETSKRTDANYKVNVSYIEIYNNEGYDLLDENHSTRNLSDLNKVIPRETADERLVLSGLSVHKAQNEEQALNLLFIGDTNRVVSETPKNDASTRSHCIFIIQIEGEKVGSDGKKTQARLYLVDLSGSERVGKTGVKDLLLKEAREINLSLHYLEHVIICLNKKARGENIHVPYRNSLMTLILRDSLGGNSKTRMVATISAEKDDIDESISTCKFAQRVALIKNSLLKNDVVDPALIIQRLKKENEELRAEIAFLKDGNAKTSLEQSDIEDCKRIIEGYIADPDPGAKIVLKDMLMISQCFYLFKHKFNDLAKRHDKQSTNASTNKILKEGLEVDGKPGPSENSALANEEIKKLKLLVQQRDNEILILLNLINKQKANGPNNMSMNVPLSSIQGGDTSCIISENPNDVSMFREIQFPRKEKPAEEARDREGDSTPKRISYRDESPSKNLNIVQSKLRNDETVPKETVTRQPPVQRMNAEASYMLTSPLNLTTEQLKDRAACFELFRKSYRRNQAMEETKEVLKEKIDIAKQLGLKVNNSRTEVTKLKNKIEELRKERALQGLMNNENEVIKHPMEEKLANEIEKYKDIYKDGFKELKDLKAEIESIQTQLKVSNDKLQKDFEKWLDVILQQNNAAPAPSMHNTLKESQKMNLNNSTVSNTTSASRGKSSIVDPEVARNLDAFYKARDEIYKN